MQHLQHSGPFESNYCITQLLWSCPKRKVFRSDVILRENLQGAPSHLLFFVVQIKQGPVKQNKKAHRGSQHHGKKESFTFIGNSSGQSPGGFFHIKCSASSILVDTNSKLSCQQGIDKMYCLHNWK